MVVVCKATRGERTASGQGSIASYWEAQPTPVSWVLLSTLNLLALLVYLAPSRPSGRAPKVRARKRPGSYTIGTGNPNASH